jgi:hypothetical protein
MLTSSNARRRSVVAFLGDRQSRLSCSVLGSFHRRAMQVIAKAERDLHSETLSLIQKRNLRKGA